MISWWVIYKFEIDWLSSEARVCMHNEDLECWMCAYRRNLADLRRDPRYVKHVLFQRSDLMSTLEIIQFGLEKHKRVLIRRWKSKSTFFVEITLAPLFALDRINVSPNFARDNTMYKDIRRLKNKLMKVERRKNSLITDPTKPEHTTANIVKLSTQSPWEISYHLQAVCEALVI